MADLRESFPMLENVSTSAGVAAGARVEGNASAAINGLIGFSFKDSSGNVILPQLNASGQLPVTFDVTGENLFARGTLAAGSASLVTVTGAVITLTTSTNYEGIEAVMSCFRDSLFQIIWNDNGVETILADTLCGPGQFTTNVNMANVAFTSGATGTQELLIKAQNINALSAFRATVGIRKVG